MGSKTIAISNPHAPLRTNHLHTLHKNLGSGWTTLEVTATSSNLGMEEVVMDTTEDEVMVGV